MFVLGIESSCDDTCVAIINNNEILANVIISQHIEQKPYAGVVPEIAARSHVTNIQTAFLRALEEAKIRSDQIDVVAASCGPGLIGGVMVGCVFGKTLASILKKPFIAVNHLEGHALMVRLVYKLDYPYLLLLVSGGHSQFIQVRGLGRYKILGTTLDDAVGEAFDKVAKMLNLGFPGGPEIERRASKGFPIYDLPKPLINQDHCNLSLSGLKTAAKLLIEKLAPMDEQKINDVCASFQQVVAQMLRVKTLKAMQLYEQFETGGGERSFVLSGGVGANLYIRQMLTQSAAEMGYNFLVPPINLCTDNGVMIAQAGWERFCAQKQNDLLFRPRARWSLEEK
ncbi:tRNA N6-adenosine threonylcarbamoyltransferase [Rickettsiales endosymbiont of Paramecium tredecaurelia]|nr:tRNA N6-adenosine threonylcarbamoyltransferase [Candidatus Sarmatiella mevalonica]